MVSSFLVYQRDKMRSAPGRKIDSTKPRKNLIMTMPAKFWTIPVRVEMRPQTNIAPAMYQLGQDMRLMRMLEGIWHRT